MRRADCIRYCLSQLYGLGPLANGVLERLNRDVGIVAEEGLSEIFRFAPGLVPSCLDQAGEPIERFSQQGHQIDGMSPGIALFAAHRGAQRSDQGRQNSAGVFPTNPIQQFESFVGEVHHMAVFQVEMIGCGCDDDVSQLGVRHSLMYRC